MKLPYDDQEAQFCQHNKEAFWTVDVYDIIIMAEI
jgi:hypothetical protein